MNSLTEVVPAGSTVSRETISKWLFKICYLTAITVSTIGWVSAFVELTPLDRTRGWFE
jgi:hypothetical protein